MGTCFCSSYDAFLLAKNKPSPVPTSIVHAPSATQQFGVSLQLYVSNCWHLKKLHIGFCCLFPIVDL